MVSNAETAELAALLIEWKRRSGLSYGVLAKRLHMSASTLHRYCRGEALPPEFATVERFARLCRATPEEHAEAHRRWIAADTARHRDRRGPKPEPAGALDAFEPAAPGAERAGAPSPRRSWPRFAWAAGGALAAGLAIALLAGLLTGGDGEDGNGDGAPEQPAEAAPLAVATRPYAFEECESRYLVDLPPSEVPPPPSGTEAAGWVGALGAVPAGQQLVELTVQGTEEATVVLRDLRVSIAAEGEPLPWHLYGGYAGCGGGPVRTTAFDVDLDTAAPRPAPVAGQADLPLSVDANAPLVLFVDARTDTRDVSWYLELDWSSGDRSGVLRVDDEGRPFRTSAVGGQTEWGYMIGGTEWIDAATGEPAGP
ncbi:helix-turn-helix domain-containing protein [Streptomyces sp. SBT349]|uniref:helix-turn-helix domain-containing protein n=1 Tax=Streptomyces sp. SBT349 TaxID=1580539 RepID=UPI00066A498B|nr:helix-turn-helix transcriptional regulator [Streptomyces sp. SBT349]